MRKRAFTEVVVSDYEKFKVLAKSHFCTGMNKNEVQLLVPLFHSYHLDPRTDIYEEGDTESFLCLIVSGAVDVYVGFGMPSEKVISTLGPGETVGEMSVIDELPRSASVVANTETILYALTRRSLVELSNSSPGLWAKLIFNIAVSLCHRLRQANDMLADALADNDTPPLPSRPLSSSPLHKQPFLKAVET